ncbi:MAG TPA: hypothetical protein VG755_33225 [Nannocystaceae bacterium]|nr:hypothetical protein [Nannocystaceae bacterium]
MMTSAGIALWLLAAANPQVAPAQPSSVPAPQVRAPSHSPYACRPHDRADTRDARLRRSQIAFGVLWAIGSAAVIGGAVGVGVTAGDCVGGKCKGTIASAAILGVGIPVATTGLIGFAVSTGIRRGDRRSVNISLAPTAMRMRF